MRAGVAQGGLFTAVLFSLYVNNVELALYADDAAIIATSRKPTLLVSPPVNTLAWLEHDCLQERD
jgi:hypothetical protein